MMERNLRDATNVEGQKYRLAKDLNDTFWVGSDAQYL